MRNEKGQFIKGHANITKKGKRPNFHDNSSSFKKGINPCNKGHGIYINCQTCGKEIWVENNQIGRKKFCSMSCRSKSLKNYFEKGHKDFVTKEGRKRHSVKMIGHKCYYKASGKKNWRWISDRTKLKTSEYKHLDSKYKIWMLAVKNRDNWKCKINNKNCKGKLEAHHILPWSKFPELRYEINNGILLCHFHHPHKRNDEIKLVEFFKRLLTLV